MDADRAGLCVVVVVVGAGAASSPVSSMECAAACLVALRVTRPVLVPEAGIAVVVPGLAVRAILADGWECAGFGG